MGGESCGATPNRLSGASPSRGRYGSAALRPPGEGTAQRRFALQGKVRLSGASPPELQARPGGRRSQGGSGVFNLSPTLDKTNDTAYGIAARPWQH
jgi:hypothetical protein